MSEQDFRERVLSVIDDLKRTIERMDDRTDKRLTTVEKDVSELRSEVKRTIERMDEKVDDRFTTIGKEMSELRGEMSELRGDIRWIRGKFEGRQEATSNKDVKTAIWIALGSALAAIVSLIKSFWN